MFSCRAPMIHQYVGVTPSFPGGITFASLWKQDDFQKSQNSCGEACMLLSLADSQFARSFFPCGPRSLRRNFYDGIFGVRKWKGWRFTTKGPNSPHLLPGTDRYWLFEKEMSHLTQFFFTNNKNNKTSISTYLIICLGIKIFSRYLSVKVPTSLPGI